MIMLADEDNNNDDDYNDDNADEDERKRIPSSENTQLLIEQLDIQPLVPIHITDTKDSTDT